MRRFIRSNIKDIFVTIISILAVIFICSAVILIDDYRGSLTSQSADAAQLYTGEAQKAVNDILESLAERSRKIASGFPKESNSTFLEKTVTYATYECKPDYTDILAFRYVVNGKEYHENGVLYEGSESVYVRNLIGSETLACTGIITDENTKYKAIAFYVPMDKQCEIDALVIFYYKEAFDNALSYNAEKSKIIPSYSGICSADGMVMNTLYSDEFPITNANDVYTQIRALTNDKTVTDKIERGFEVSGTQSTPVTINGVNYVIVTDRYNYGCNSMFALNIFESRKVYAQGYEFTNTVFAVIIIIAMIVITLVLYIMFMRFRTIAKLDDYDAIDPVIGCPNKKKFTVESQKYLAKNKVTKYAMVYVEIAHYSYIEEHFGEEVGEATLKYLAKVFAKNIITDEAYGRLTGEKFAILLHYSDMDSLMMRLNVMSSVACNFSLLKAKDYKLKLGIGVYCVERNLNLSIQKLVDRAMIANKSNASVLKGNIRLFDEKTHTDFLHEAEIEAKMEEALRAKEFKIFYQPKYNIKENKPDGSEALVRWYNPKTGYFRPPSEFLALFEANGFIANLDRYVFAEVCKHINEASSFGYRVIPVSVNVSRVTATQEGFLNYYIKTKNQYGIRNGLLTIEFTESFAFENYDVLFDIIMKLHENGFKCSIDDFGSGYSSYNVLKDLPMDELKLDKFFIKPGISNERDDKLLETIITLAKSMNMKVTQEGVELPEDLERLKKFGCDVIQGYIYSKPMALTDYVAFIKGGGHMR